MRDNLPQLQVPYWKLYWDCWNSTAAADSAFEWFHTVQKCARCCTEMIHFRGNIPRIMTRYDRTRSLNLTFRASNKELFSWWRRFMCWSHVKSAHLQWIVSRIMAWEITCLNSEILEVPMTLLELDSCAELTYSYSKLYSRVCFCAEFHFHGIFPIIKRRLDLICQVSNQEYLQKRIEIKRFTGLLTASSEKYLTLLYDYLHENPHQQLSRGFIHYEMT